MTRILLGLGSLLFAVLPAWAAYRLLITCILPWRKAPETMHITLNLAGFQLSGWQLLAPMVVLAALALALAWFGISAFKNSHSSL